MCPASLSPVGSQSRDPPDSSNGNESVPQTPVAETCFRQRCAAERFRRLMPTTGEMHDRAINHLFASGMSITTLLQSSAA